MTFFSLSCVLCFAKQNFYNLSLPVTPIHIKVNIRFIKWHSDEGWESRTRSKLSDPSESKASKLINSSSVPAVAHCVWKEKVLSVASFTKRDDNSASYHVCKIMIVMPLISIIISHIPSLILIIQKSKCSWRFVTSTQEKPTQSCWRSCFSVCLPAAGSSLRILFICSWTGKTPPQRLKQSFTSVLLSITKQLHNYTTARQYWGVGVFQLFVQFADRVYSSSFCFLELWQDGQISADELQRCLTQSGMAGSYKRKETRLCFKMRYTLTTLKHCKRGTNHEVSCYIKCDVYRFIKLY